jgi:hypothetical protein
VRPALAQSVRPMLLHDDLTYSLERQTEALLSELEQIRALLEDLVERGT